MDKKKMLLPDHDQDLERCPAIMEAWLRGSLSIARAHDQEVVRWLLGP
ncbi:hypothetical protein [uncultured Desulfovibrio sp.]|nr:hypothetical protein [uncultured Desulfovibrio sp.]